MKRTLISAFSLLGMALCANTTVTSLPSLLAVPTYTQVNKLNGGLFGYRTVTTDQDNNGNTITVCSDPGVRRCRVQTDLILNGGDLSDQQLEEIDNQVTNSITPTNLNGQFMYGTGFLVVYSYDTNTDQTQYQIYTYAEAVALGLL